MNKKTARGLPPLCIAFITEKNAMIAQFAFDTFIHENLKIFRAHGKNWAETNDGTQIHNLVNFENRNINGYYCDQIIFAGIPFGLPQDFELMGYDRLVARILGKSCVPAEFQILYI